MSRIPHLPWLDGPPPALPRPLDAASERFWRLRPRARATLVALVATLLALGLALDLTRSPWGPAVAVTVAARDLPPGHHLSAGDLTEVRWPRELAPADPLPADAEGTLLGAVPRAAPVTSSQVGADGLGALLGEGRAAVGLPLDLLAEHTVGARLDLVHSDHEGRGTVVASRARILAVDDHAWVEVEADRAADVAAAARAQTLVGVVRQP